MRGTVNPGIAHHARQPCDERARAIRPRSRLSGSSARPGLGPGIDILGVQPLEMSAPVVGAPFSADTITEFVQEFVDGNRMEQRMVGSIARDGIGRVRRELPIGVAGGPRLVTITLARRAYSVPSGQCEQDRLAPADAAGAARSSRESRQEAVARWNDDRATHCFVMGRVEDRGHPDHVRHSTELDRQSTRDRRHQ